MNGQNAGNAQQMQATIHNLMQSTGLDMRHAIEAIRQNPQLLHQQAAQLPAQAIMPFQQQPQMPQHSPTYSQFPSGQSGPGGPFSHPGMLPMTGQLNPALPQGSPTNPTGFMGQGQNLQTALSGMDPGALARQMQALNDASRHRANQTVAQQGPVSARPVSGGNPGFTGQTMVQSQLGNAGMAAGQQPAMPAGLAQQNLIQQQKEQAWFYNQLRAIHQHNRQPLPPAICGLAENSYDVSQSKWKTLQVGSRPWTVAFEGGEIDLWKMYAINYRMGGFRENAAKEEVWVRFADQFHIPPQVTQMTDSGPIQQPSSQMLRTFYEQLLKPVEDARNRQTQQFQQRYQQAQAAAAAAAGQAGMNGVGPQMPGGVGMGLHSRNPSQTLAHDSEDAMKLKGLMDPTNAVLMAQLQASQVNGQSSAAGQGSPPNVPPPNFSLTLPSHLQRGNLKQEPTRPTLGMQATSNSGAGIEHTGDETARVSPAQGGTEADDAKKRKRSSEAPDDDARKKAKTEGTPLANTPAEDERTAERTSPSSATAPGSSTAGQVSAIGIDPASAVQSDALANGQLVNGLFAAPTDAAAPAVVPRRKVEYIPWRKDFEMHGGRSLVGMDAELAAQKARRGLRDLHEFGPIDIERVTMCLRSGLSVELSYALTVLSFLSMVEKHHALPEGFILSKADDLTTVLLDLLEETAFKDCEDRVETIFTKNAGASVMADKIITHHDLCKKVSEVEILPLPSDPLTGEDDSERDPLTKPSGLITVLLNLFRNFSVMPQNATYLTSQTRFLELLMKLCAFEDEAAFKPLCPVLQLTDLIDVRKSVMHIIGNVGSDVRLSAYPLPVAHAIYSLEASFIVDPVNAVGPVKASVQYLMPRQGQPHPDIFYKPPTTADHALEGLSRIMIPDDNRAVMSSFSQSQLWTLFDTLIHMLPMTDNDFQLYRFNNHHDWLSYSERVSLCLYSVTYLAPTTLKARMRRDISYRNLLHRLIEKVVRSTSDWDKNPFSVLCRRMVETLGIIVDRQDNFTTSKMLPFGTKEDSAYGEKSDDETPGVFLRDELLWIFSHVKGVDEPVIVEVSRWASDGNKAR